MPNRDTWFKCDPTAFLDGIETLTSDREVALYVVIVMKIYAVGGPISNNPATLAAQSHIDPRWAKRTIDALVKAGKLTITDDGKLSNPRADAELSRRRSLSDTRSKAGKSGGRPPKSKGPTGPDDGGVSRVSEASVTDLSGECPPNVPPLGFAETAENRQSEKPIAFTRARERER